MRLDEESFAKDLDFIKAMIRYEIDLDLFGVSTARKNLASRDPQLQFALTQFGEAEKLTQLSRARTTRGQ